MTAPKQDRQSARRAIRALFILQGHVTHGLRLTQIAEALKTSLPNALRDLDVLAEEGVAERHPEHRDYWRLTPKLGQIAAASEREWAREHERINEFRQRHTREPQ